MDAMGTDDFFVRRENAKVDGNYRISTLVVRKIRDRS